MPLKFFDVDPGLLAWINMAVMVQDVHGNMNQGQHYTTILQNWFAWEKI